MAGQLSVLVFDRNKYIRKLLKREFLSEGYQVHVAQNIQQLLSLLKEKTPYGLMILDLELPDMHQGLDILKNKMSQRPELTVVVHTFAEVPEMLAGQANVRFVEKNASSVELIKAIAGDLLKRTEKNGG